jgi:asparagine synthase (glutamine-hydrolysing)
LLPQAIWHREQPFGLGVEISRWLIAEMSARHVKVVLCGEGADEALGGYAWYRADKALAVARHWPMAARRLAATALRGRWPGAATILQAPAEMGVNRFRALSGGATNAATPADLLVDDTNPEPDEFDVPEGFTSWHRFAQLQYLDFKLRLAESVLQHLDTMSMAHSLEARVPFLDHQLVEFCSTIPPQMTLRRWQEKAVLRDAMRGVLPPEISQRKKVPMSAPVRDWMRPPLPELAMESLSDSRVRAAGYFHPACVARLLRLHQSGAADHSRLLLLITGTHVWDDLFNKSFA